MYAVFLSNKDLTVGEWNKRGFVLSQIRPPFNACDLMKLLDILQVLAIIVICEWKKSREKYSTFFMIRMGS